MTGRRAIGAVGLSALAAMAFWAGWYLNALTQGPAMALIGAGAVAAPVLLLIGRNQPVFLGAAGLLLAVFPIAGILAELLMQGSAAAVLAGWRLWPLILGALAASLALSLLSDAGIRTAFATGAFLFVSAISVAVVLGYAGVLDRWLLRTPVHTLIVLIASVVYAAQLLAWSGNGYARSEAKFTSGMIQLLPLLGFAGTILGIMTALQSLPRIFDDTGGTGALDGLLTGLSGAFETTLLGLFASIAAAFINTFIPERTS